MKSYIQGLITGAVFVFAIMVLMGQANISPELSSKLTLMAEERDRGLGNRYVFSKEGSFSTWYYSRTGVAYHKDELAIPPVYYKTTYKAYQDSAIANHFRKLTKKK